MEGDTPTHRVLVRGMSDDALEVHLNGIRERRLRAWKVYKEAQDAAKEARDQRLRAKLDQQIGILERELDQLDKKLEKVEKRCLNVRSIKLELELDTEVTEGE